MKHNQFFATLGAIALLLGSTGLTAQRAQAIGFTPPADNSAPHEGTGGASRGSFFTPPADNSAPHEGTGGASRGSFFTPPADNSAPAEATGGASRGGVFTPPADNSAPLESAPLESSGGASRGDFFAPPVDNSAPESTSGGAARGNTYGATNANSQAIAAAAMKAVMPDSFYGTTLEARPTILVYVPASNASEAVFSLKSESKELVHQMTVAVPQNGGVVAISLPADAPELAVDANYQWYLALMLDNELSPASPFVDGWVKRIAPTADLTAELAAGEGITDVAALGANGIWYDTAAQLAMLTEAEANEEMANHWYELLESVGLEAIADAPVVMM
ncbi:MAG: DUF928 domain-containing protein [Cyanobacteria bacterium J06581_3]